MRKILLNFRKLAIALLIGSALSWVQAAPTTLNEVVSKTIQTNPEVVAKWHEFKAAGFERDVTWGRNLPSLDVLYGTAYQRRESPILSASQYNFQTTKVTLRQNLFEGFATVNDTRRLEHSILVRFYEMLDTSESAAFEATKAYSDVWRNRKLVEFAEENYVTHRLAYTKVKERAQSGVGRQVDMETASGRLALAESNLLTETANLHDVSARYQRIVGELPKAEMEQPPSTLAKGLPKDRTESIKAGFEKAPRLKAAFENIFSAKRNVEVQKSGFYPRVDAYLERVHDINTSGYTGNTNESTAGVTMTWNLFRGNQDNSKKRKAAEEVNIAKDLREKVCREVRQNLSMSFNDHLRLTEQLQHLDQHQLSTDKVRTAFRNQFDIGQRTLLDVLDIENEYYTAKRNYLNAEIDLVIADSKYHAMSGNLLNTLNLKNLDMTPPTPSTTADEDMFNTCPAESDSSLLIDKEALFSLALEKDRLSRTKTKPLISTQVTLAAEPLTSTQVILAAEPVVIDGINFLYKSAKLMPGADTTLKPVAAFAKKYPEADIEIIGHTDNIASEDYNLKLSEKRAEAVKSWLVKNGVNDYRIKTKGMGKTQPIASNDTEQGRAQNRRVEVHYTVAESDSNLLIDKETLFSLALEKDKLSRTETEPLTSTQVILATEPPTSTQVILAAEPVVITGANFSLNSAKLMPSADTELKPVAAFAKKYPEADIEVIGHTDSFARGVRIKEDYNLKLSEKRAEAVKSWLVKNGVNDYRIKTKGMGKTQPIASNDTEQGRAQNRRVEVRYTVHEEQ